MLGLQMRVQGTWHGGAKLLVANHVSWLDIMAVHAVCPEARFVSKADVRHWPILRHLVDCAQTLYIERERKRDALRVVHQMTQALRDGDTIAIFPEGTTGAGLPLLPFHANLLQAALASGAVVQPVLLRYADGQSAFSEAATYLGDTSLLGSVWMFARAEGLVLHLTVMAAEPCTHQDRRLLAHTLREQMGAALSASAAASSAAH
jgi:1-acyl-sn-glycerol-3-phosphate acyltransferase